MLERALLGVCKINETQVTCHHGAVIPTLLGDT